MNSYNENLHSSVINSLNKQEIDLKKIAASRDAAMFSLYYAEGARITASEKVNVAMLDYNDKRELHEKAVQNNNIAINLIDSSTQGNAYTSQSISNIAVGAANVQVAANAILKLASDAGSIYTIAKAADFDTQIHEQAEEVYSKMNETAYDAEVASQLAMEASSLTAQVSSSTVLSEAKGMGTQMSSLLGDLSAQFDASADLMATDNKALATTSDAEKKSEGLLEDINVEFYATNNAYDLTNKELNYNLKVLNNTKSGGTPVKTNSYFTVQFSSIRSPFKKKDTPQGYPVTKYFLMLTKSEKKSTFSIATAEGIIASKKKDRYIEINPDQASKMGLIKQTVYISELKDTDNDGIELGESYTVFLYAKFTEEYKTDLNNFENYLSAPSPEFVMQNELNAPKANKIKVTKVTGGTSNAKEVKFEVVENKEYKISYRLMLLPDNREFVQGLLTSDGLRSLESEVERLERIADQYDPKIAELEKKVNTLEANDESLNQQKDNATTNRDNATSDTDTDKFSKEVVALTLKVGQNGRELRKNQKELRDLIKRRKKEESQINPNEQSKPGFFFNLLLAEQVPAGSYITYKKEDLEHTKVENDNVLVKGVIEIPEDATDNFGNRLLNDVKYIPVILCYSEENDDGEVQFLNALSDFTTTTPFINKL